MLLGLASLAFVPIVASCTDEAKADKAAKASLPPLSFQADTPGLMLTWIDDRGSTHVVSKPSDVPKAQADFVRVLIGDSADGATDPIYVADVSDSGSATFNARSLPRSEWEDEIERRRKDKGGTAEADPPRKRQPSPPPRERQPPAPGPSSAPAEPAPENLDPAYANVRVVVYGANWCGSCKAAMAHFKHRGVKATFKNIEEDSSARAEMVAKVERAGVRGGVIPIVDVGGQIMAGFSSGDIDRALKKALGGTMM